jgi:hypothetical protein
MILPDVLLDMMKLDFSVSLGDRIEDEDGCFLGCCAM